MALLTPAPVTMGLSSPAVGPWFSSALITLPAPAQDFALALTVADVSWYPPAAGVLSVFLVPGVRLGPLRRLRRADGSPAFDVGHLVALFRLLPEVEDRLHALCRYVPAADRLAGQTSPAAVPTRARVRQFAVELLADPATPVQERIRRLITLVRPALPATTPEEIEKSAADLGLELKGGTWRNAMTPMSDLKRPGLITDVRDEILHFGTPAQQVRLWCFDASGHAIDPGAVATWWKLLADRFTNLWAPVPATEYRTAGAAAARTAELVTAHEGALTTESPLLHLLTAGGQPVTGPLLHHPDGSSALALALPGQPPDDSGPQIPLLALLPHGGYRRILQLWNPQAGPLSRDHVRVALVDVEQHLTGSSRGSDRQWRRTTRVEVHRTPADERTLLAAAEETTAAALRVLAGDGRAHLVTPVLDRDWGSLLGPAQPMLDPLWIPPFPADQTLPDVVPPSALPDPVIEPLRGSGQMSGEAVTAQHVAVTIDLDARFRGGWVRIWTQGFDREAGEHVLLDGAAGRLDNGGASARAVICLPLPDGTLRTGDPPLMGVVIQVATRRGARIFTEKRFSRPVPVGGVPARFGAGDGLMLTEPADNLTVCEAGLTVTGNRLPTGAVSPGASVLARVAGSAVLVDRSSLPSSAFGPVTFLAQAAASGGVTVELTHPAFAASPEGSILSPVGSVEVHRQIRHGASLLTSEPGAPLPLMERLEVVSARAGNADARAVVGSVPALGRYHEMPPNNRAHPGAPGAAELHGTGVNLAGRAALAALDVARDRVRRATHELLRDRIDHPDPQLADPASPGCWVAVLRTVAPLVEGDIVPDDLIAAFGGDPLTVDNQVASAVAQYARIQLYLAGISAPWVPPDIGPDQVWPVVRAFDRRVIARGEGLREGHASVTAAIGRAEDLVYIETPAVDVRPVTGGSLVPVLQTLHTRMTARPALHAVLCLPSRLYPGWPRLFREGRDALLYDALDALADLPDRENRLAWFAPSAGANRHLRLCATTVIVDDAYALTGTTHMWRRGASFDSSVAAAAFDERLDGGRPAEVRSFRRQLLAHALSLSSPDLVPDDPAEIVLAVRALHQHGDGGRLSTAPPAKPEIDVADTDIWNPAALPSAAFDPVAWALLIAQSTVADELSADP